MLAVAGGFYVYRKRNATTTDIKKPPRVFIEPSPDTMTSTKSKVPLERLVSEA